MNIGSITKIEIALLSDISFSTPDENNIVQVTPESAFEEISFTFSSAKFIEDEKYVIQGIKYFSKLEWKLAKQSPNNYQSVNKYTNKEVIIKITDANGTVIIIGDADVPVYIMKKRIIPAKPEEFNGYLFSAEVEMSHSAYFSA